MRGYTKSAREPYGVGWDWCPPMSVAERIISQRQLARAMKHLIDASRGGGFDAGMAARDPAFTSLLQRWTEAVYISQGSGQPMSADDVCQLRRGVAEWQWMLPSEERISGDNDLFGPDSHRSEQQRPTFTPERARMIERHPEWFTAVGRERTLAQSGFDVLIGNQWPSGRVYLPIADTWVTDAYGVPRARSTTHDHRGMDLRASEGTPFRAARDGYVVFVLRPENCTPNSGYYGYGGVVMLWHPDDGVYTWYAHLSNVDAAQALHGEFVGAGKHLGFTGRENGNPPKFTQSDGVTNRMPAHLHMEVRRPYPGSSDELEAFVTSHSREGGRAPFPMPYGAQTISPEEWFASFGITLPAHDAPSVVPGSTAALTPDVDLPSRLTLPAATVRAGARVGAAVGLGLAALGTAVLIAQSGRR